MCLSGAGLTVMTLTSGASEDIFMQREKERTDYSVAKAMTHVVQSFGIEGKIVRTQVSHELLLKGEIILLYINSYILL